MPIKRNSFECSGICFGYTWIVEDEERLAELVGELLRGQVRHVSKVLQSLKSTPRRRTTNVEDLIGRLTVAEHESPSHRDGWIFQCISWIAARLVENEPAKLSPPHMGEARKGFDAVILSLTDDASAIDRVYICEDKATKNPRDKIRDEVWEEFKEIEAEKRTNEIETEVTQLLERQRDVEAAEIDDLIEEALWQENRAYRVAITVGESHRDGEGRKRLFDGYADCVSGTDQKRRAETIYRAEIRDWLDQFAGRVRRKLRSRYL